MQMMGVSYRCSEIRASAKANRKARRKTVDVQWGRGLEGAAHVDGWEDYEDESDDMADSSESLEELFLMERTAN